MFLRAKMILRGFVEIFIKRSHLEYQNIASYAPILLPDGQVLLKNFLELTLQDFKTYPIWVQCHIIDYSNYWYEQTQEDTVRPYTGPKPAVLNYCFLMLAEFIFNDGTEFEGFTSPADKIGSIVNARVFINNKQEFFWHGGLKPTQQEIDDFYQRIQKKHADIFPVKVQIKNSLAAEEVSIEIKGLQYITHMAKEPTIIGEV